jgi:hypothetical protein
MRGDLLTPARLLCKALRVVALITKYAIRFDPVDRITFYSRIIRRLAPIGTGLQAQMRADDTRQD